MRNKIVFWIYVVVAIVGTSYLVATYAWDTLIIEAFALTYILWWTRESLRTIRRSHVMADESYERGYRSGCADGAREAVKVFNARARARAEGSN